MTCSSLLRHFCFVFFFHSKWTVLVSHDRFEHKMTWTWESLKHITVSVSITLSADGALCHMMLQCGEWRHRSGHIFFGQSHQFLHACLSVTILSFDISCKNTTQTNILCYQWGKGGGAPSKSNKNCQKSGKEKKNQERRKNQENLSLCPCWQVGVATLFRSFRFAQQMNLWQLNDTFRVMCTCVQYVMHQSSPILQQLQRTRKPSWWGRKAWCFTVLEAVRRANGKLALS